MSSPNMPVLILISFIFVSLLALSCAKKKAFSFLPSMRAEIILTRQLYFFVRKLRSAYAIH